MARITLEKTYYLTQIIAVMALIVSLIYVGREIHQNTQEMRLTSAQMTSAQWSEYMRMLAQDDELTALLIRAERDMDGLDEVQRRRVMSYASGWFGLAGALFFSYRQGASYEGIEPLTAAWRKWLKMPLYRETWDAERDFHDKDFQAFIDSLIREGGT